MKVIKTVSKDGFCYEVSEDGVVVYNGRELTAYDNGNGYWNVRIVLNKKITYQYVHRLVAMAFIDNPDNLPQVDHIDRDKSNNHYSNLRWSTPSQNINNIAGEKRYSIKRTFKQLKEEDKLKISKMYSDGIGVMEISRITGFKRQTVSDYKLYPIMRSKK